MGVNPFLRNCDQKRLWTCRRFTSFEIVSITGFTFGIILSFIHNTSVLHHHETCSSVYTWDQLIMLSTGKNLSLARNLNITWWDKKQDSEGMRRKENREEGVKNRWAMHGEKGLRRISPLWLRDLIMCGHSLMCFTETRLHEGITDSSVNKDAFSTRGRRGRGMLFSFTTDGAILVM